MSTTSHKRRRQIDRRRHRREGAAAARTKWVWRFVHAKRPQPCRTYKLHQLAALVG